MQKPEEFLLTKDKILQITKDLKSHYNHGEFFDIDKNFNKLLMNIISIFERDDLITEMLTNEELYHKYKQKYEDAFDYIKLLESNKLDNKICFDKFNQKSPYKNDNNELNKSILSGVHLDNMSHNGEHFYISDSPDFSLKNKLRRVSVINKTVKTQENPNLLMDNNRNVFLFGMEPEKLRDEYIKIFEEKKHIEHDYLIVLDKLSKLEVTEKAHQETFIQYEDIVEKTKQMSEEIINLKDRIRQIGQENFELISLNNQYIEAIETFHSESGNAKSRVLNENTKVKKLDRDLIKAKKRINDLEKHIEETNERILKEREERVFIEKQYEDYIYDQENALANIKIENEKNMRENLIEKLLELNQNPNSLNFFYNEQTKKIEIFFEDEKIFDMENAKPVKKTSESSNISSNESIENSNNILNNNLKKKESDGNFILRTKRYSFDEKPYTKRAQLSDLNSSNVDSDNNENQKEEPKVQKNNETEMENEIKNNVPEQILENLSLNPSDELMSKENKTQFAKGDQNEDCVIKENLITANDNNENDVLQTTQYEKINDIILSLNEENHQIDTLNNQQDFVNEKILDPSKRRSINSTNRRKNEINLRKRYKNSKSISFGYIKENDLKKFFSDSSNKDNDNNNLDFNEAKKIDVNNNTPKMIKSTLKTYTQNDGSLKKSTNKFYKRHSFAFNSLNNSEKLLFNVKNRLFNSDHVEKFVLENLNVDEKIEEQANKDFDANQNNHLDLNYFNNNFDNPLFKSTNSSLIHDTSFNSKAIRRTTINNFNIIPNKLSLLDDNENKNLISEKEHEEINDDNNTSRQSADMHSDSYQNIKPTNNLNGENNFILEDLIEEDRLITEFNDNAKYFNNKHQRKSSSRDNSRSFNLLNEDVVDYKNINEIIRKNSSKVHLIVDELEIDDLPIEDNNFIKNKEKPKEENYVIEKEQPIKADLIDNIERYKLENEKLNSEALVKNKDLIIFNKLKDSDTKVSKKNKKKLHRKSLSNFNLNTIDLETLTREKIENFIQNPKMNDDQILIKNKDDHDKNLNPEYDNNVIIENVDSHNVSKENNDFDQVIKEKNTVSNNYPEGKLDKNSSPKTPNYNHPKNHDAEMNLNKNLKKGLYLESNEANLKTNFKSHLKEEHVEAIIDSDSYKFKQPTQYHRKTFMSTQSDLEPKKYSTAKSFVNNKQKTSSKKDTKEIEECIRDINLNHLFKDNYEYKIGETYKKTFKKSFDNNNIKKKFLDDFNLPKKNNIRDRVFSTNITTNNHYWKYTINLVPSQESSFNNNQKTNDYSKNSKTKDKLNQIFHQNYEINDYDPAIIDDCNKCPYNQRYSNDNHSDIHIDSNKPVLSSYKYNLDNERSGKDKCLKTKKLQALLNKIPEKRKSSFLKDKNTTESNLKGFTGIYIDNQIKDFSIISEKKIKEKAHKNINDCSKIENFTKNKKKDNFITVNNVDQHNYPNKNYREDNNQNSLNSSLDGSDGDSSNNQYDYHNRNLEEGEEEANDLNKAYIDMRGSSRSFYKRGGDVELFKNKDFQILDVENESKALSICGVKIDEKYNQNYKRDEYGVDNVSEISIKNRKNILIKFCKEKDIVLNKPVDVENYPTEENLILAKENDNLNKFDKENKKLFDDNNHPLNRNNISFKNMVNESKISNKNDKWKFENKSYMQDTTILKEDKNSKCRRCSIF